MNKKPLKLLSHVTFIKLSFQIKSFTWLPMPLPQQCKLVLTTAKSDFSHTSLSRRPDVQFLTVSNLNTTKLKAEFLEDHMQRHFDHLNRVHIQVRSFIYQITHIAYGFIM